MAANPMRMFRPLWPAAIVLALLVAPILAGPAFAQGGQVQVSAVDFQFQPQTVTINAGDTVVWTNNGQVQHTVTADDNSFDSGLLSPGQTFSQTFNTPGTFPYHCSIHGAAGGIGMSGTVVVQAAAAAPQPTQAPAPTAVPTQPVAPTVGPTEVPPTPEVAGATPEVVPTQAPTETPAPTAAPTQTPVPAQVAGATPQVAAATPSALPSTGDGSDATQWPLLAMLGLVLAWGGLFARSRLFR
jgi:plastocyanin